MLNKRIFRVPDGQPKVDIKEIYDIVKNPGKHIQKTKSILKIPESSKIKRGDIIGISINNHLNLGIYLNDDQVIHYRLGDHEKSKENILIQSSLNEFLRNQQDYFVLDVNLLLEEARNPYMLNKFIFNGLCIGKRLQTLKVYPVEDTIERAKSKIGIDISTLQTENCEHIAFWAKTGGNHSVEYFSIAYRIYHKI